MGEESPARQFARDIVLLEQTAINPVVVHGGGPQIATMLKRLGIKSEFAQGLRITDAATIEIVEMVLAGSINKQIVGYINEAGGKAVGLCGKDGNMVIAEKATRTMIDPDSNIEKIVDLGFVEANDGTRLDQARLDRFFHGVAGRLDVLCAHALFSWDAFGAPVPVRGRLPGFSRLARGLALVVGRGRYDIAGTGFHDAALRTATAA